MKHRVAIYLRLSNEDRDKVNKNDNSESIKNQRNLLMDFINMNTDYVLIDEYCDEDLSGAGTYRPEFERLIKDCELGKIDIVLCKSQSRFSRDMEVVEKYINNKFSEWNVRFIGLSDSADTKNMGNKKARQINGLVNEWFLEDVSNNIRSAFVSKMKNGEFISPFAPFGYDISKKDNNKLVIDYEASLIVKKIYHLYLKGFGYTAIANYLNDSNIPSPSLYKFRKGIKLNIVSNKPRNKIKWNANAVKTILKNEVYIGNLVQGKRTTVSYKNHKVKKKEKKFWIRKEKMHEAIIDNDTFNKVQAQMKERFRPLVRGSIHILSGKVFCLECNYHMRKKNSNNHEYLVCSNIYNEINKCVNKCSVRYDILNKIVIDEINNLIAEYYNENLLKDFYYKKKNNDIKSDKLEDIKKEVLKKIENNKRYLQSIYEDKINKVISDGQFNTLASIYRKKDEEYKKKIKYIENDIKNCNINRISKFNKYKKIPELNRVIIQEFIDKIYIGKCFKDKRKIVIKWNFE